VVQVHKKNPYKSSRGKGDHDQYMQDLAMIRAVKIIEELQSLGVPADAMKPKVETTDRTTIMQYCQMDMAYKHIIYDSEAGKITLKKDFVWEKRLYSRDQQDIPDAQFQEPEVAKKVFAEVLKVIQFLSSDLDVVVHKTYTSCFDDEHKQWLDELLWNRAEKAKDELVEVGLEDEKVEARVEPVEEEGFGMHFEIVWGMRATPSTGGPKGPDHMIEAQGSGVFEFNGRYKPAGNHNGEIKYRHMGGGKQTITNGGDTYWYMCINHDTNKGVYKSRDLFGTDPWKHCSTSNTGLCPVVKKIQVDNTSPTPKGSRTNSVSFQMP